MGVGASSRVGAAQSTDSYGLRMHDYRESQLPVMLNDVHVDGDRWASVRLLYGDFPEPVIVRPGEMIGETGLSVVDVQQQIVFAKQGRGEPVDVSRMIVEYPETGERHLVVRGLPAMSNNVYDVLTLGDEDGVYDARRQDQFTAAGGEERYRILDVRTNKIVILLDDTGETVTFPRTRN